MVASSSATGVRPCVPYRRHLYRRQVDRDRIGTRRRRCLPDGASAWRGDGGRPQPLLSRPLVLLLVGSLGALGSFFLLLPVLPLYAASTGAGPFGAGLSTGVMMLGTVLVELAVPVLLTRCGYRSVMAAGLLLLGAPAVVLAALPSLPVVLAVCLVRGVGLGIVVVAGTALVAEVVPPSRLGEGLGLYGVAVGIPTVVCLPLGLWLRVQVGYGPVFLTGAALALLALVAAVGLPARAAQWGGHRGGFGLGLLRDRGLARPTVLFGAVTLAAGVQLSFLPLAVPAGSQRLVAVALLVQSAGTPLARWGAGRYGDRHGSGRLLLPAVLAAAVGTAALVRADDSSLAVVAGAGLFGVGFGIAQNATLTLMFERAPAADVGRVSAVWNLAYDGGMGVGAVGFGVLAGAAGYPVGFAVTAAVLVLALGPAWRDRV